MTSQKSDFAQQTAASSADVPSCRDVATARHQGTPFQLIVKLSQLASIKADLAAAPCALLAQIKISSAVLLLAVSLFSKNVELANTVWYSESMT